MKISNKNKGTLRQCADGRWELTIMTENHDNGSQRCTSFYGKTQKEVLTKAMEHLDQTEDSLVVNEHCLFSKWVEIWFENHRYNISPSTQEYYGYILRALNDAFGNYEIADITSDDIESFLSKLRRDGRSESYLVQCRGTLYQIFNNAESDGLIRKNPVCVTNRVQETNRLVSTNSFTAEEVKLLLEHLPDDRIGWSIRLLLATGMRVHELLALEPVHIEEDGSYIHIGQTIRMDKDTVMVCQPMSQYGYRDVPVPENVRDCAIKLRTTHCKFIWSQKDSEKPCSPSVFRKQFKEALTAIEGVRILSPYCCRHTYVRLMEALGVDMSTIQRIIGRVNLDMTEHDFLKWDTIPENAIAPFSEAFGTNFSQPEGTGCKV